MEKGNSESHDQEKVVTETSEQEVPSTDTDHVTHEENSAQETEQPEKTVPVSALQKERKKRQQLQQQIEEERNQKKASTEEDYSRYESVTKEELGKNNFIIKREVREEDWSENHPDRAAYLEEHLDEFLQQKPNLALAIQSSGNRLREAWELMEALKPKKAQSEPKVSREAPRSPGTVPKSATMGQSIDLMNMSDTEFRAWRKSQAPRRR